MQEVRWGSNIFPAIFGLALRKKNGSYKGGKRGVVFVTGERNQRYGITRVSENYAEKEAAC